jgi:hypothetical protein
MKSAAMPDAGLYIVTLTNNEEPISVNANAARIADAGIRVARLHCKFGKASSPARRRDDDCRAFGAGKAGFRPIALTVAIGEAERVVLWALDAWRVRGNTGRKNEWLVGIAGPEVVRIALDVLRLSGIAFEWPVPMA